MEDVRVYFAKLNLSSSEIYKVIKKTIKLESILQVLLNTLKSGVAYQELRPIPLTTEEIAQGLEAKFETIDYKLEIINKNVNGIEGLVFKTSKLYYNKLKTDNSLETSAVDNTEVVRFYLDVFNEYVGFNRKQRFGYQQFATAFQNLINKCLEEADCTYRFSVSIYTEGLNLEEIKTELKRIKNIQKLEIQIQPPNPDDDFFDETESSLSTRIEKLEEARASIMKTLLEATGEETLNMDSQLVEEELDIVKDVYGSVNTRKAVSKGYVKIRAETQSGVAFTSDDNRPKTIKFDEEKFVEKVKGFIAQILVNKKSSDDNDSENEKKSNDDDNRNQ